MEAERPLLPLNNLLASQLIGQRRFFGGNLQRSVRKYDKKYSFGGNSLREPVAPTTVASALDVPEVPVAAGREVAQPPAGESVTTTYDREGFTAVIKGQFADHWRKIN